jgi:hypothetical protein
MLKLITLRYSKGIPSLFGIYMLKKDWPKNGFVQDT